MAYSTYTDFVALYGTELTEEQYAARLEHATALLDTFTARRSRSATGYKLDAVKRAECSLVRLMHAQEQTEQGKGLTSISNEGYSESYVASTPEQVNTMRREAVFQWLSGTGLMSAL